MIKKKKKFNHLPSFFCFFFFGWASPFQIFSMGLISTGRFGQRSTWCCHFNNGKFKCEPWTTPLPLWSHPVWRRRSLWRRVSVQLQRQSDPSLTYLPYVWLGPARQMNWRWLQLSSCSLVPRRGLRMGPVCQTESSWRALLSIQPGSYAFSSV